jgi:hypothetical protein
LKYERSLKILATLVFQSGLSRSVARILRLRSYFNLASVAIRKAQFTQNLVAYKVLLFETTSPKLPNLLKMISHLLLTVLTNFSRNVTLNLLSRATVGYLLLSVHDCFKFGLSMKI